MMSLLLFVQVMRLAIAHNENDIDKPSSSLLRSNFGFFKKTKNPISRDVIMAGKWE
ncbi:MAG: hypothetical protein WC848_01280 [Parcubacteria group bacterium]